MGDLSIRFIEHEKQRDPMLLCFVPRGDVFYLIIETYDENNKKLKFTKGPYMKLAYQYKYGYANALDLWTGEIFEFRENEVSAIRVFTKEPILFEEFQKRE